MKRLIQYAISVVGIFAMLAAGVGIAFSIWHDLRPAPQPVAPTGEIQTELISAYSNKANAFQRLAGEYKKSIEIASNYGYQMGWHRGILERIGQPIDGFTEEKLVEKIRAMYNLEAPINLVPANTLWNQYWTNRAPAWNLDLPPSGSTNTFDPFNLDHETRTKHEHNRNL